MKKPSTDWKDIGLELRDLLETRRAFALNGWSLRELSIESFRAWFKDIKYLKKILDRLPYNEGCLDRFGECMLFGLLSDGSLDCIGAVKYNYICSEFSMTLETWKYEMRIAEDIEDDEIKVLKYLEADVNRMNPVRIKIKMKGN